jgi:small subunit ribosomal protein S21
MKRYNSYKQTYGITVEVKNDNFDRAFKIFTKKVQTSGILKDLRERDFYEKPSVKKTRASKIAVKVEQQRRRDSALRQEF